VRVIDTNVLLCAADQSSEFHTPCRSLIDNARRRSEPTFLTWNICYEFLRVSTHPRVFDKPWNAKQAWDFLSILLGTRSFHLLTATERHRKILGETLSEIKAARGNIMHDLHTAVSMREHGVHRICTRDTDFHRFGFLEVVDPLKNA